LRAIPPSIAVAAPAIEIVIAWIAFDVGAQLIGTVKGNGLTRVNWIGGARARHFTLAIAHVDDGGVTILIHADTIGAGAKNIECEIGRVDFEDLILIEAADANVDCAFGEADLNRAIVKIEKREAGLFAEANGVGIDSQFGAGALVGPELVAFGHGAIDGGIDPFVGASRSE
jgi:hypothetical protein